MMFYTPFSMIVTDLSSGEYQKHVIIDHLAHIREILKFYSVPSPKYQRSH